MPNGPVADVDEQGVVRVGWGEPDWFGPGRAIGPEGVACTVRAETDHLVFRSEAITDLDGLRTDRFEHPSVGWPVFTPGERLDGGIDADARALAYLGCEFALPTRSTATLDGWMTLPGRPATAWPLIVRASDGRTMLLAPLDAFHEQIIGLDDGTLRCGWHGDLDSVPAGFSTELAIIGGRGPRECLDRWGRLLLDRAGTRRLGRYADVLVSRPSYWTDNGAAHWYRTEPGHDVVESIVGAVDGLRDDGVPVGAVQLDSWFYPHAVTRPFDTDEWEVPPTAMVAWEERPDVLPAGIADLRERLGRPPLVAHIRHLAASAPIATQVPVAVDGEHAVPTTPAAYERWLDQCVSWGVEVLEHDWLVDVFHRNRWLRERPGRARAWQEGIDAAARERGITLQWCMATPADFAQTVTLSQVTSIRTSGDHGYIATPGQIWAWFCTTNALARSLGLTPFKDVFRTDPDVAGELGEPEAMLSALSTGPVGLGDRVGRFRTELAHRCCRADGVLIKPDVPVAATDDSILGTGGGTRPMFAECWSRHPAGRWWYVVAMHCRPDDRRVRGSLDLAELTRSDDHSAAPEAMIVWDRRHDTLRHVEAGHETSDGAASGAALTVELEREQWSAWVIAPVLACGLAVIGDLSKFASAGDARLAIDDHETGVEVVVKGAGETVTITGWARRAPGVGGAAAVDGVRFDEATGRFEADVTVPPRGWTTVTFRP